jgi:hypothetical protein
MIIRAIHMPDVTYGDFLPQAVINKPASYFSSSLGFNLVTSHDEFDEFEGGAFILDDRLPFTILHYKGHPVGTTTVYLPPSISDVGEISEIVHNIMRYCHLERNDLLWQRSDNPDL